MTVINGTKFYKEVERAAYMIDDFFDQIDDCDVPWYRRIIVSDLNMVSCTRCVIGQICGDWCSTSAEYLNELVKEEWNRNLLDEPALCGNLGSENRPDPYGKVSDAYRDAWAAYIKDRIENE